MSKSEARTSQYRPAVLRGTYDELKMGRQKSGARTRCLILVTCFVFFTCGVLLWQLLLSLRLRQEQSRALCLAYVHKNLPRQNEKVFVHHWFTARANQCLWNEDRRFDALPQDTVSDNCVIFYVGAHTHGGDGVHFQQHSSLNCHIHVFEPHPEFYEELRKNWGSMKIPRATLHNYGLGDSNRIVEGVTNAGVNTFGMQSTGSGAIGVPLQIRDTREVLEQLLQPHEQISLFHANCEGCEWEMLETLIRSKLIQRINVLQWSSHWFKQIRDVEKRYCDINGALSGSHVVQFQQPFGWDRWYIQTSKRKRKYWTPPKNARCSHAFAQQPDGYQCCRP